MTEQKRVQEQTHRRRPAQKASTTEETTKNKGLEDRLQKLDLAIDELLDSTRAEATGQSVVASEEQTQKVRTLSDEELWKEFRQQGGE